MKYNILIIGGGIVGLATAYQLVQQYPDYKILLLEKEDAVAKHQTGSNSGVIHSGIYYKPGSLKAQNCIQGYEKLIDFCQKFDVPYELCGKVIVATDASEIPALDQILRRGKENGLEGLKILSKAEIKEKEPHVEGIKGIYVPQTGIVDYKEVSQTLARLFQEKGGEIRFGERFQNLKEDKDTLQVETEQNSFKTDFLINCSGLYSDKVAAKTGMEVNYRIIPFRGEYYELKAEKAHLVKNLIYPVPDPAFPFLGVHFTRMINGGIEAGPNAVFAFKREGYRKNDFNFEEFKESLAWPGFRKVMFKYWRKGLGEIYRSTFKSAFTNALQKLIPEIQEDDLVPGGAGVRAQACERNGGLIDDFLFLNTDKVINVCNAPSPAATSSLAIGDKICETYQKIKKS